MEDRRPSTTSILVPTWVAKRTKRLASALAVHRDLEHLNGCHDHSASIAAWRATDKIGRHTYREAKVRMSSGNRARHEPWADQTEDGSENTSVPDVASDAVIGDINYSVPSSHKSRCLDPDPLFVADPWAGSLFGSKKITSGSLLRSNAPVFSPASGYSHIAESVDFNPPDSCGSQLGNALRLISQQNDTIALLFAEVECLRNTASFQGGRSADYPVAGSCFDTRLNDVECSLRSLASSLADSVQSSVEKRTVDLYNKIDATTGRFEAIFGAFDDLEKSLHSKCEDLNVRFNDKLVLAVESCTEGTVTQVRNVVEPIMKFTTEALKRYDIGLQRQIRDLEKSIADAHLPLHADVPLKSLTAGCGAAREMSISEFLVVAAGVRRRHPHLQEQCPPPLMICDVGPSIFEKLGRRIDALLSLQPLEVSACELVEELKCFRDDLAFGSLPSDDNRAYSLFQRSECFLKAATTRPCRERGAT